MNTDTIADFLTRIRNAIRANHRIVDIPSSNIKKEITKVLHDKGFISNYKFEKEGSQGKIKIALKYNSRTKISAIEKILLHLKAKISISFPNHLQRTAPN